MSLSITAWNCTSMKILNFISHAHILLPTIFAHRINFIACGQKKNWLINFTVCRKTRVIHVINIPGISSKFSSDASLFLRLLWLTAVPTRLSMLSVHLCSAYYVQMVTAINFQYTFEAGEVKQIYDYSMKFTHSCCRLNSKELSTPV